MKPRQAADKKNQRNQETKTVHRQGPTGSRYGPRPLRLDTLRAARPSAQRRAVCPAAAIDVVVHADGGPGAGGAV